MIKQSWREGQFEGSRRHVGCNEKKFLRAFEALQKYFFLFASLFSVSSTHAEFVWNDNCVNAYTEVSKLNFKKANHLLATERKAHPANLIPVYIESEIDFLLSFISEDEAVLSKLKKNGKMQQVIK